MTRNVKTPGAIPEPEKPQETREDHQQAEIDQLKASIEALQAENKKLQSKPVVIDVEEPQQRKQARLTKEGWVV